MNMKIQHFIALVVLSLATISGARAATNTWTGADPSGYWSAPANWTPAGVPVNGNDLVFPGGLPPGDMVSTNGRLVASGDVSLSSGYLLPSADFNPQAGQVYTIVEKTS